MVQKTGLPLIISFYGSDVSKVGKISIWQKRYKELFAYGHAFLAEGSHLKEQLVALGCPPEKVIIQRLGVDIDKYPKKSYSDSMRASKLIILQAASFREKKGIRYSLESLVYLKKRNVDFEFRLIGWGEEIAVNEIREIINRYRLEDVVTLLGITQLAELLKEMASADIFLHPSVLAADGDNEGGAPVGIIEASAIGLPIVATYHADIPEVVIDNKTGFLAPERDAESLGRYILRIAEDRNLIEELGSAGSQHIRQNYNLHEQIKKLETIYSNTIQK